MKKKKNVIVTVIIIILIIVLATIFMMFINNTSKLKGQIVEEEEETCTVSSLDQESYMTVSGSIIKNEGGTATSEIKFEGDGITFTKELDTSSSNATEFLYNIPRGTYTFSIISDGYQTYSKTISDDVNNELITLYSNAHPTLYSSGAIISYSSGAIISNQYYKYYTDGTLYIYQEGYQTDVELSSALYSVVTNILNKYNTPLNITDSGISGDILQLAAFLSFPCVIGSDYWSVVQESTAGRASYIDSYNKIDSGICNDNNLDDSACENVKKIKQFFGSLEKGKRAISIILSIPINTDVVIDDSVKTLYDCALIGTVDDDFDLPEQIASIGDSSFYMVKYNTLRIPGTFETAPLFMSSLINNIIIEEGVETLVSSAFANLNMDKHNYASVSLPSTLKTISDSAFRKAYINNINLQEGLESIESEAFNKTQLSSITIPSTVTSIGSNAFANITTLTEVTVNGNKTRFNNNWNDIGFPSNLMPTN